MHLGLVSMVVLKLFVYVHWIDLSWKDSTPGYIFAVALLVRLYQHFYREVAG